MRTLAEQAAAVAAREVSPVELVERALAEIERVQLELNAFTRILADDAFARAKELTDAPRRGPLHGVPIAIKELYDIEGLPTTGCCAAFHNRTATSDSTVVAKLREAGAIVVAKTNQHELACGATNRLSSFGPAFNPWGHRRTPGGSSGGSGAAVASGVVGMAMGSDTGGSVRIPSSFCGITGLKTTHGAVSLNGAMPLCPTLDTAGPLAASARDCALVFEVIAGFDPLDRWSARADTDRPTSVSGLRVGILSTFLALTHHEVKAAVEAAAGALESLGAVVDEVDGPDVDEAWTAMGPIFASEFAACYPGLSADDRVDPEVRALLTAGESISATAYVQSSLTRRDVVRRFESALAEADVLLAPATPYPAPPMDALLVEIDGRKLDLHTGGPARLTAPVNVAGLPAVAFPVGLSSEAMPIGAQLIGPEWSELRLCSVVAEYQQATDWHLRSPS